MFFCFLLNAQQKEAVKAKKVFKIQPDRLMEQVMVSLEFNDIFITAYDLKKGTVVTEYKKLTLEKMKLVLYSKLMEGVSKTRGLALTGIRCSRTESWKKR
jgi:hypothetical protein